MAPETQIEILKALSAIELLSKNTAISILLSPKASIVSITENIRTIKYKLSVIEGVINKTPS